MSRNLLCLILLAAAFSPAFPGEVIYESNFAGVADGTPLDKLGWTVNASPERSRYFIEGGKLRVECFPAAKLRGGYAELDVPLCAKGVLEFDLNPDSDSSKPGIALFMDLYNMTFFWHDYCKDWRRYFPEPVAKRGKEFDVEPVGHRRISEVAKGKGCHYKICFDKDNDRVEYYKDNMEDPAFIDGGVAVWGRDEYLGGRLRLGNWGVGGGKVRFLLDNIKLTSLDKKDGRGAAAAPRERILLFNGLSFNRYQLKASLLKNGVPEGAVKEFNILNPRPALTSENSFVSDILPSAQAALRTKCFVLADYPFGPGEVLPDCVVKDILENVRGGARLVVFGGLLSLGKGEYGRSSLAEYLPVKLGSCWDLAKCERPLPLAPVSPDKFKGLDWSAGPMVFYMHNLELAKDARVLLKAGERPLLVSKRVGDGEILVFLGAACGAGAPGQTPFWKWTDWGKLVAAIVKE